MYSALNFSKMELFAKGIIKQWPLRITFLAVNYFWFLKLQFIMHMVLALVFHLQQEFHQSYIQGYVRKDIEYPRLNLWLYINKNSLIIYYWEAH